MKEKDIKPNKGREDKEEIDKKKKKEEWLKKEKTTMIEQRKEYINYIKGVMQKKGFNPKLRKDKFSGGVRGRG
jgi:predicted transcriptional regulator